MPGTRRCSRSVRRGLHVEVVESNDAIDGSIARHKADAQQHVLELPLFLHVGHVEDFVDAFARPVFVLEAVRGEQQHPAALATALTDKVGAFVVAG